MIGETFPSAKHGGLTVTLPFSNVTSGWTGHGGGTDVADADDAVAAVSPPVASSVSARQAHLRMTNLSDG